MQALRLACDVAFAELAVDRLDAAIRDDNERSLAAFRRAGFGSSSGAAPAEVAHEVLSLRRPPDVAHNRLTYGEPEVELVADVVRSGHWAAGPAPPTSNAGSPTLPVSTMPSPSRPERCVAACADGDGRRGGRVCHRAGVLLRCHRERSPRMRRRGCGGRGGGGHMERRDGRRPRRVGARRARLRHRCRRHLWGAGTRG